MSGGLTPGDPLGERAAPDVPADGPERPALDAPRPSPYGSDRVPPGAFAPRVSDEVPAVPREPAEYWRRVVAALLDAFIIGLFAAFVFGLVVLPLDIDSAGGAVGAALLGFVALLTVAVAALLYAPLVMARTNGRTLGKAAVGIRVVRADGRRIDFLWAVLREVVVKAIAVGVAAAVTGGIAYLVDVLWPLWDRENRAVHDIVVDSRVVRG